MPLLAVALMCGLVGGIILSIEMGRRLGIRRWARVPEKDRSVNSTMESSIFGLMGLLTAFTFFGAGARFDTRRTLIAQEANAIGTAYLRIDLLPPQGQPQLREDFRKYLRARLAVYREIPDFAAVKTALKRSEVLQMNVWRTAMSALKESGPAEKSLVVGSLNEMIDITTDRNVALATHPPAAVFAMLGLTVMASSALVGYTMAASGIRDWVSVIIFALVVGAALYVIVDYEFPRVGLLRVDSVDQVLVQTLEEMN